ncbi:MAG: recombinase family protein [Nitrosopumilus sp.]|nr:recombinase family protein [Nitrosopumilus sp.]
MSKGKTVGYIRVSSFDQNEDRQLESLVLDKVFMDKASGKDVNRPQLQQLIDYVRDGDTVVVHSLDRLARNLDNLRKIVQTLNAKEVKVHFIKENLIFTGEDSPMSNLLLSVMGAFAEFERNLIRERQSEGIVLAKNRGVYKGRKKCLTSEQVEDIKNQIARGESKSQVARVLGISRETLYQYLRRQ